MRSILGISFSIRQEFDVYSENALHWLNWFERELDNIRATLNLESISPQGLQFGVVSSSCCSGFGIDGHFIEGLQWAEKSLAVPDVQNTPPRSRRGACIQRHDGVLAGSTGTALSKLQETLAIEQRLEDDRMVAIPQMANGIAFINMGRDGDAQPLLGVASQFFEAGHPYFHALTLVHLGNAELGLGQCRKRVPTMKRRSRRPPDSTRIGS